LINNGVGIQVLKNLHYFLNIFIGVSYMAFWTFSQTLAAFWAFVPGFRPSASSRPSIFSLSGSGAASKC